jgi:hypothetical protein
VFYKVAYEQHTYGSKDVVEGVLDFLEPDNPTGQFGRYSMALGEQDAVFMRNLLVNQYESIMSQDFGPGCGDCVWCRLVRDQMLVSDSLTDELFVGLDDGLL